MARVKRGVAAKRRHKKVLEQAKGYYGNKSRSFRAANEQVLHSGQYAFRDRRAKKGEFRRLWIQRINAACRLNDMSYSRFIAGLNAAGRMERDMMRTYAAGYWQTLFKLRLPAAAPFIFNALKINSTLALIGAIVAEFFGTPIVGMGFRIATEVGRLNADMVWAEVAVAAVAGSASYGLIVLIERAVTFWHPSVRGGRA